MSMQNVAWSKGVAGDGVFGSGQQHTQAYGQLPGHNEIAQSHSNGGAAHVLFHLPHARAGLNI